MKKIIPLVLVLLISFSFCASAASYSLYANLDDSNSYCNLLIDYYNNLDTFDPFNEYVVLRDGQYSYSLVYGKDLSESDLHYIRFIPATYGGSSSLSVGDIDSFDLSTNGFTYVGNVSGSLTSSQFQDFKVKFLLIIGGFIFLLVFLFKVFKPRFVLKSSSKRYDL